MNHYITKQQYEALKETGLNFATIAKKHLTEQEINEIPFQDVLYLTPEEGGSFANYSSFASWIDQGKMEAHEAATANIKALQNWDRLVDENVKLRSGFVLLGVNAGAKGMGLKMEKGPETFEHFEMFQLRSIKNAAGKREGIPSPIKYKNALSQNEEDKAFFDQAVSGTYMTDFIKGFPTSYGPDIKNILNKVSKQLNYDKTQKEEFYNNFSKLFAEILENELDILGGQTHTIVVMGLNPKQNIVNNLLERSGLNKKYNVVNIRHYSGTPKQSVLAEDLKKIFKSSSNS